MKLTNLRVNFTHRSRVQSPSQEDSGDLLMILTGLDPNQVPADDLNWPSALDGQQTQSLT